MVKIKDDMARPLMVVDGTGSVGLAGVRGTIKAVNPRHGGMGCSLVAGGWGTAASRAVQQALAANVTVDCGEA